MRELSAGTVFAGHRIESVAGRGGMGVVYRATQLALDRTVALKVIAPGLLDDQAVRQRFVRESKIAASIDHPNVIPIYYAGEEEGIAYIAMRYVAGDDLRSLVRREGPLGAARAARMIAQAGAALDAAHGAGLVHRDVKPANLLLGPEDHVYLTDFGLTKHALSVGGTTRPGHWVGTLDYVAPEQIRGERIDARVDVYALGCVLYYALAGHVPFDREGDEAKLWAHLSEPPPKPRDAHLGLPAAVDDVVARALAKNADDRYPSAGDLGRAALAAAAGDRVRERERLVATGAAAPVEAETRLAARAPAAAPPDPTTVAQSESATPPAGHGERHGGRRAALVALGLVALVGAAVGVTLALAGGSGERPRAARNATPTPAVRPLSEGPTLVHRVRVGNRPNVLAVAGRNVFVGSFRDRRLRLIDARTGKLKRGGVTIGLGASDAAAGLGAIWFTVARERALVRLSPRTGRRIGRPIPLPGRPQTVTIARGSLWVGLLADFAGGNDRLVRVDPRTGAILSTTQVPLGIVQLAASPRGLWSATRRRALLQRFDLSTGALVDDLRVGSAPAQDIAYSRGSLWVAVGVENTVYKVDTGSRDSVAVGVGARPQRLAVGTRRAFVTNYNSSTLSMIDVRRGRTIGNPIDMPTNPYAVAIGRGSVWVAGTGENRVVEVKGLGA